MSTLNESELRKGIYMTRYKDIRNEYGSIHYPQISYPNMYNISETSELTQSLRRLHVSDEQVVQHNPKKIKID